jgi:hypothetical protein
LVSAVDIDNTIDLLGDAPAPVLVPAPAPTSKEEAYDSLDEIFTSSYDRAWKA